MFGRSQRQDVCTTPGFLPSGRPKRGHYLQPTSKKPNAENAQKLFKGTEAEDTLLSLVCRCWRCGFDFRARLLATPTINNCPTDKTKPRAHTLYFYSFNKVPLRLIPSVRRRFGAGEKRFIAEAAGGVEAKKKGGKPHLRKGRLDLVCFRGPASC